MYWHFTSCIIAVAAIGGCSGKSLEQCDAPRSRNELSAYRENEQHGAKILERSALRIYKSVPNPRLLENTPSAIVPYDEAVVAEVEAVGPAANTALLVMLTDSHPSNRHLALRALVRINGTRSTHLLTNLLSSYDPFLRAEALWHLANLHPRSPAGRRRNLMNRHSSREEFLSLFAAMQNWVANESVGREHLSAFSLGVFSAHQ